MLKVRRPTSRESKTWINVFARTGVRTETAARSVNRAIRLKNGTAVNTAEKAIVFFGLPWAGSALQLLRTTEEA